jgi:dipeptidyl aminopeptidase/acylaminoacyl peptidase
VEAQKREPLPVEAALAAHSFAEYSPVVFSPNGKWVAYAIQDHRRKRPKEREETEIEHYLRTGVYLRNEASDLLISNAETGSVRNLTGGVGSSWDPSWSSDGRYLAFLSNRDGGWETRVWVWDSVKDELRSIPGVNVRAPSPSPGLRWTPDSRKILITIVPEGMSAVEYERKILYSTAAFRPGKDASGTSVTIYSGGAAARIAAESGPFVMNLGVYYLHDLALVDVASGAAEVIVRGRRIDWYTLSPDGGHVAYSVPQWSRGETLSRGGSTLLSLSLTSRQEQVVAEGFLADSFSWSPDGSLLCYGAYDRAKARERYYVAGRDGGPSKQVGDFAHGPRWYAAPAWDSGGRSIYLIVDGALERMSVSGGRAQEFARIPGREMTHLSLQPEGRLWTFDDGKFTVALVRDDEKKREGFYKIDLVSGTFTKLLEDSQCYSCKYQGAGFGLGSVTVAAHRVAYVSQDAQHPPELWVSDSDFRESRQLTHLNPEIEKYEMGSPRLIEWLSDEGERLQGELLLPAGYVDGKRYPLLVWVYPNMLSNQFDRFGGEEFPGPYNPQIFATRGYAVFLPDVRNEKWNQFAGLAKCVLPGVNKVIEMGIADPERLAVAGHSHGGNAVLSLIVQTKRFKAAVAGDGYGDLTDMYGALANDGIAWQWSQEERELGGSPWQLPLRYVANSPVYFLDRVETPLLLIHGEEDTAVPSYLSDEVFTGLQRLGKEVQYARYGSENHVPMDWSYANQEDVCNRVIRWLDSHLKENAP